MAVQLKLGHGNGESLRTSPLHPSASITEIFSLGDILHPPSVATCIFTVVPAADFFSLQSRFVIGADRKCAI
jgi:hypothetical protein